MTYADPSFWKRKGIDISRILGFRNNPSKYVYLRQNRYEVTISRAGKKLIYGGRYHTLLEAEEARDKILQELSTDQQLTQVNR